MRNVLSSRRARSSDLLIVTVSCCVDGDDKRGREGEAETYQHVLMMFVVVA